MPSKQPKRAKPAKKSATPAPQRKVDEGRGVLGFLVRVARGEQQQHKGRRRLP